MELSYRRVDQNSTYEMAILRKQMLEELSGAAIAERRFEQIHESILCKLEHGHCLAMGAFESDKIIACAMLCYYHALPDENSGNGRGGVLCNVYTLPEYRNRGIMTNLMIALKHQAKDEGVQEIILTAEENAIPLYEKLGFLKLPGAMVLMLE